MSLKALDQVYLPRTAKADDFYGIQSEETNNNRVNGNFRKILVAVNELETSMATVVSDVIAQLNLPDTFVSDTGTDGIWEWREWNDGTIEAFATTIAAVVNCTTAYGALYGAQTTISFPTSLFASITELQITPICSGNIVFVSVVSVTASTITVKVITTASSSVTVQMAVRAIGK